VSATAYGARGQLRRRGEGVIWCGPLRYDEAIALRDAAIESFLLITDYDTIRR
jgi:hypothetical protein